MSTPDGWIKMSERKPTGADMPVLWYYESEVFLSNEILDWLPDVHWQPAKRPAPPAKELTQREKDEEAFKEFWNASPVKIRDGGKVQSEAFLAGIAYRDGQNRDDVRSLYIAPGMPSGTCDAIKALRARCGLDT